jgi:hypothetical protein
MFGSFGVLAGAHDTRRPLGCHDAVHRAFVARLPERRSCAAPALRA